MDRRGFSVFGAYRELMILREAEKLRASPPAFPWGRFHVIVADPPWRYDVRKLLPYPTMHTDDIKALPVRELAEENAVLWLWTTNAHLPQAFEVASVWGFEYKTLLTWVKTSQNGKGTWLRGITEHCLLCSRGKPAFRYLSGQTTMFTAGQTKTHSEKPEEFYRIVEQLCPGTKVELFGRRERLGWSVHDVGTERTARLA